MTRRRIVITGAGSGIGAANVALALEAGYLVAGIDLSEGRHPTNPSYLHACGDVTDAESIADALTFIRDHWGAAPDSVVHCAGVYRIGASESLSISEWDEQFAINVRGSFVVAQAAARQIFEGGGQGSIVLLSSVAYSRGDGSEPAAAYAAGKGAVVSMVRQLAVEWGPRGIRVNAIAPGVIDTPMTLVTRDPHSARAFAQTVPLRRVGAAADVAASCLFLAGPDSAYITGVTLPVDGGLLVS